MRKRFKKFVVVTMACMLTLTPMTVFAEDTDSTTAPATGDLTGSGDIEGIVNKDVFCVTLPTIADNADTFDFILDPQGLIKATANAAHSGDFEETASLFFHNSAADAAKDYSSTSDSLEIVNKSTFDVDVTVNAEVKNLTDATSEAAGTYEIVMKDTNSYTEDTATSMYLALNLDGTATALAAGTTKATATIDKVPEGTYEVTYSEGNYAYTIKDDADDSTFDTAKLSLTGSCNTSADADWDAAKDAAPSVEVTWSVDKHVDGPSISITTAGVVTFSNLTAEKNVNAKDMVTYGATKNTTPAALDSKQVSFTTDNWTAADGGTLIMTLGASYKTYYAGDTMTLKATLSDGSIITGTVTFPAAE